MLLGLILLLSSLCVSACRVHPVNPVQFPSNRSYAATTCSLPASPTTEATHENVCANDQGFSLLNILSSNFARNTTWPLYCRNCHYIKNQATLLHDCSLRNDIDCAAFIVAYEQDSPHLNITPFAWESIQTKYYCEGTKAPKASNLISLTDVLVTLGCTVTIFTMLLLKKLFTGYIKMTDGTTQTHSENHESTQTLPENHKDTQTDLETDAHTETMEVDRRFTESSSESTCNCE